MSSNPAQAATSPALQCPVFHPALLAQDMTLDAAYRWGSLVLVVSCLIVGGALPASLAQLPNIVALGVVIGWVMVSVASTRTWRTVPTITALMDHDPVAAESMLALAMRRRLLHRPVRLLLYHRLAVLRHRQQRFAEAASICHAVLRYDMGNASHVRPHLLLMLVEAKLLCGDLHGAYEGLVQLAQMQLSLVEATQRAALQTRYQIASGYYDRAIGELGQTLALAELMPPPQAGAMHAMLAFAARHANRPELAQWLQQRAELLCTPDELQALANSGALVR
jgi:hypothetical protein